jgi:predicted secreted Zn-dependent protease
VKRWCPLLALVAVPADAQTTDAFAGLPYLVVRPYDVMGTDAVTLRASIDANRPTDPHGRAPVDAGTHWTIGWRWTARTHRGCDLAHARVTFRATVTLPRLADPASLPPPLADAWNRYIAALERHEAGHVRYAYDHRGDVAAAIRGATCATAERAARAALAAIVAHDIAYDRDTQHGLTQGASFP